MTAVGIRALKQNASAVIAQAAAGERVIVTDNGRPVAQILPLGDDRLANLEAAGLLRMATRSLTEIGPPPPRGKRRALGDILAQARDEDDR